MEVKIRRARTGDVREIRNLVDHYAPSRALLEKPTVTLYEDVQEFWVAEASEDVSGATGTVVPGTVVGCGALHVMWEDLAEVRTVAANPAYRGRGIGHQLLQQLLDTARQLGVRRVFVLTFEVDFFARHGFRPIEGAPVSRGVYGELLRSYDEGVAEFLDLEWVKPNTLGNTRMLRYL